MAKKKKEDNSIQNLMDSINESVGKGSVLSFEDENHDVETISSGSIFLDKALGGGFAVGRVIEIYGKESSGKTTIAMEAIVEYQKKYPDKVVGFLDVENAYDPNYGLNLGIDQSKNRFIFSQPESGEIAFRILEKMVDSEQVGLIIVDSVAAMTPQAEIDGDFGESKMGLHARLMSQGMRKLIGKIKKSNTTVIFLNQTRMKIGISFGDPTVVPGGEALKFYASQRLQTFNRMGTKDGDGELQSNIVKVKVKKNKIAPPHREAEFQIRFGEGIDKITETIEVAVELDIIQKKGSYFSYDGTNIGQGLENTRAVLLDNVELHDIIKKEVINKTKVK